MFTTRCEEPTPWKRPWCWEWLKAGGEGDDRGWGGWMESVTQWTWVWVSSGSWWWTGKTGVLQSMGVTKNRTWLSNWTELILFSIVAVPIYTPTNSVGKVPSLHFFSNICCLWPFWQQERKRGRGQVWARDWEVQTTMYKINKLQGHIVEHREYGHYFIITLNGV